MYIKKDAGWYRHFGNLVHLVAVIFMVFYLLGCSQAQPVNSAANGAPPMGSESWIDINDSTAFERAVLQDTNRLRLSHGLAPLRPHADLSKMARWHAGNMANYRVMSHDTPDPQHGGLRERKVASGINAKTYAENVAKNFVFDHRGLDIEIASLRDCKPIFTTTKQYVPLMTGEVAGHRMFEQWRISPGHLKNMLNPDFTHMAAAVDSVAGGPLCGEIYGAQVFAGRVGN